MMHPTYPIHPNHANIKNAPVKTEAFLDETTGEIELDVQMLAHLR